MMIKLRYDILKVSTNAIYSWMHWTKRKKLANLYHNLIKADCKKLEQITEKVDIDFKFYFKTRYLDSSNCGFMAKMLEDWLVNGWLLEDDTNKYIWKISLESVLLKIKDRKKINKDYVTISIAIHK